MGIRQNAIRYCYDEILSKGYSKMSTDENAVKRAIEIELMFGVKTKVEKNNITLIQY